LAITFTTADAPATPGGQPTGRGKAVGKTATTAAGSLGRKGECMEDRPQFGVELVRAGDEVAVVVLQGEVDIYSAPQFKEVMIQSIEEGAKHIVVDLAGVTFIDSTALGVLVSGAKRVRPQNGTLDIVCQDENITRIFEITGLDRIFGIYPTREKALESATV